MKTRKYKDLGRIEKLRLLIGLNNATGEKMDHIEQALKETNPDVATSWTGNTPSHTPVGEKAEHLWQRVAGIEFLSKKK